MPCFESVLRTCVLPLAVLAILALSPEDSSAEQSAGNPWGTYYLRLDAEPYLMIPGFALPGIMTIHADRTVLFADAGDFGGLPPLFARDTAQFGSWRFTGKKRIVLVALFLQADTVGNVLAWYRVEMRLAQMNRDLLGGKVNVYKLECVAAGEIPSVLNCPDPIESQDEFLPEGPADVPITLKRLRPRLSTSN